jgi:hypothetical protein
MSDIVERLRTGHPSRQTTRDIGDLLEEAADEIERLRNEINVLKAEANLTQDYEEVGLVEALEKLKKLRKTSDKT